MNNKEKLNVIRSICENILNDDELMSSEFNTTLKLVLRSIKGVLDGKSNY